jgi:hypothetical protein
VFLTPEEVRDLTHRTKGAWQARALKSMGIPFHLRPDGTPAVLRDDLKVSEGKRRSPQLRFG